MNLNHLSDDARNLNWLVGNFTSKVPGVANTLVLSADGLPLAISDNLDREAADQLSAIASGLSSLTHGAARCLAAGAVKQSIVEMEAGFLFVQTISDGSILSVLTTTDADLGLIGYEMALLVSRVGDVLTPALRVELQAALPT
ncbi:roadblock/LC7 domain-containing protein [Euzebya tangerina]|uniref:roadblock/LC7 domain-containing protein n=1 Tax=Euzebya tangerina TaxID=591198 RepID=UPI000E3155F4|nr:roadblock/LC7 domain-containing protein [Euzebya tangerina]